MIIDRSKPAVEVGMAIARQIATGQKYIEPHEDLPLICEGAIREALVMVHEGYMVHAEDLVQSQIEALRTILAECLVYQEELVGEMEVAEYGRDPSDANTIEEVDDLAA